MFSQSWEEDPFPGLPPRDLEQGFRVRVQSEGLEQFRGIGISNLAGCSGHSENVYNKKFQTLFLNQSWGTRFQAFHLGVESKGSEKGLNVRVESRILQ